MACKDENYYAQLVDGMVYSTCILTGMLVTIWCMIHANKRYFDQNPLFKLARIFVTAQIVFGYYLLVYQRNMIYFRQHGATENTDNYLWSELKMLQLILARLCIVDYPIGNSLGRWKEKFNERYSEVEADRNLIN